jgi:protease-4
MQENDVNDTGSHLARELLKEKRSERRWRNFRFLAWFALICFVLFKLFSANTPTSTLMNGQKYVALIRLDGMIAPGRGFSGETVIPLLHDAFADKHAAGVIIDINSPGGTPVQAAMIHDAIIAYKKKYNKKVIVVGEDMLTSGAYYVAVAADKIYVNPNTLTGSIGVIIKGFGFVDLMSKLGIERRVYTSGADKDRLDPFLPQSEADMIKIREVMGEVQANFAQAVTQGRQGKLHGTPEELFTGDFWSGQTALKLGLVDGLGNLLDVVQKEFNTTEMKEYGGAPAIFKMLGGGLSSSLDTLLYTYL